MTSLGVYSFTLRPSPRSTRCSSVAPSAPPPSQRNGPRHTARHGLGWPCTKEARVQNALDDVIRPGRDIARHFTAYDAIELNTRRLKLRIEDNEDMARTRARARAKLPTTCSDATAGTVTAEASGAMVLARLRRRHLVLVPLRLLRLLMVLMTDDTSVVVVCT